MKNKKLLTAAVSTALVAVVGIGATLAYFTDSDETTNIVTMGHVDITLTEEEEDVPGEGLVFNDVMPGDVLDKTPIVTLEEDSQDAYIRMKMDIQATSGNITAEDLDALRQETPLERIGMAEDVAESVLFLASEGADFITGQVICPNGGLII